MGLNMSVSDGRSDGGAGFWFPKKLDVGARRGSGRAGTDSFLGLDELLVFPPGVNVLAAGLGRNSIALTLKRVEMLEVGVREPLEGAVGPLGGTLMSLMETAGGTFGIPMPDRCCCCVMARRWLRWPGPFRKVALPLF